MRAWSPTWQHQETQHPRQRLTTPNSLPAIVHMWAWARLLLCTSEFMFSSLLKHTWFAGSLWLPKPKLCTLPSHMFARRDATYECLYALNVSNRTQRNVICKYLHMCTCLMTKHGEYTYLHTYININLCTVCVVGANNYICITSSGFCILSMVPNPKPESFAVCSAWSTKSLCTSLSLPPIHGSNILQLSPRSNGSLS